MPPTRAKPSARPSGASPRVRARGLVLARGGHTVLARSDFELAPGSLTALIGPNGAGKTSLLDGVAGLLPIVRGSLEVLGTTPRQARPRVAYVLQTTTANEVLPLTAREVVMLARYPRRGLLGRLRREDRDAVDVAMERLGVADLRERHLHELSGGQRQRILVAQGLAQEADLLLLDEPLSGVDLSSRERILQIMAEERARGRTLVVATHDLAEAEGADQVLLLAHRVVASGPPSAVITPQRLSEAYGGRVLLLDDGLSVLGDPHHHPQPRGPHNRGLHPQESEIEDRAIEESASTRGPA